MSVFVSVTSSSPPPLCHITMLVSTVEAQGRLLQAMLVWILF